MSGTEKEQSPPQPSEAQDPSEAPSEISESPPLLLLFGTQIYEGQAEIIEGRFIRKGLGKMTY